MSNPTVTALVADSGQSIVLLARDASGANTGVTSLAQSNEVQTVRLTATPTGSQFQLTSGGHTTAEIPTTLVPPPVRMEWNLTLISGKHYNFGVSWGNWTFTPNCTYNFQVLMSGGAVATLNKAGTTPPNDFQNPSNPGANAPPASGAFSDSGVFLNDGVTPVYWFNVNSSPVTATATTATIQFTGSAPGDHMTMEGVRVENVTDGTIAYYNCESVAVAVFPNDGSWALNNTFAYDAHRYAFAGSTAGIANGPAIDPGGSTAALALQGALEALASIGSGNIAVTDLGAPLYRCEWIGSLAGTVQSLMTCTDTAVAIAETGVGGSTTIKATINGGSAIPLPRSGWIYDEVTPRTYLDFPLFQSSPAVQTAIVGQQQFEPTTDPWQTASLPDNSLLSKAQNVAWTASSPLSCSYTQLKPGTYQFAITFRNTSQATGGVTYQPYSSVHILIQDGAGTTLHDYTVDQTVAPADYAALGVNWKVLGSFTTTLPLSTLSLVVTTTGIPAQSGSTQQVATIDAVQLKRTSSDLSLTIQPSDVVTLDIPAGAITTEAGAIPSVSALAVAPPSPTGILGPPSPAPKTMKCGMNVDQLSPYSTMIAHSNLALLMTDSFGGQVNSDGYPTKIPGGGGSASQLCPVVKPGNSTETLRAILYGQPREGVKTVDSGKFVMVWKGDADPNVEIIAGAWTTVTKVSSTRPTNLPSDLRYQVYDITCGPQIACPNFNLHVTSTTPDPDDMTGTLYLINLTYCGIFPPDPSDPTGQKVWGLDTVHNTWAEPPKFHPYFLAKLKGLQSLRFLGPNGANVNCAFDLNQYKPLTHRDRINPLISPYLVKVASIAAPPGGNYFFTYPQISILQVETEDPHGLWEGARINFNGCGTASFSGGSFDLSSAYAYCHVIDSHNLIAYAPTSTPSIGVTMTNTLTPVAGTIQVADYGVPWPLQDVIDLCVAVPGVTDLWFNFPVTIDAGEGGGAYQIAAYFAAHVPRGITTHFEFANESWNTIFDTYAWCVIQQDVLLQSHSGDYKIWHVNQAKAVHDQCLAAFTAAGRPGDMARILGGQSGQPDGSTTPILTHARSIGMEFEEYTVANYFANWPRPNYTQDQCATFNGMTTGQLVDHHKLIAKYGGWETLISEQIPVLADFGYGAVRPVAYEGSNGSCLPFDPISDKQAPGHDPNYGMRQNAVKRHPGQFAITFQFAQIYQDAGLTLWNWFDVGGIAGLDTWGITETSRVAIGTGDPVAESINITDPQNVNAVYAEQLGGWLKFASLFGGGDVATTLGVLASPTPTPNSFTIVGTVIPNDYPSCIELTLTWAAGSANFGYIGRITAQQNNPTTVTFYVEPAMNQAPSAGDVPIVS